MKMLSGTVLSALSLCAALTSAASAQPAGELKPGFQPLAAWADTPQEPPLSVSEAKTRYLEKQKQLEELAKGERIHEDVQALRLERTTRVDVAHDPRDRLRDAVAETFDARRQLQQAELADLENRIARIKRALEIRDAMRDTIIDQRTDELLDQIEEGNKSGKSDGASPRYPGATDGAVALPPGSGSVQPSPLEIKGAQIVVEEAEANLTTAKQHYDYAKKMHAKGYVTELDVNNKAAAYKRAQLELEYAQEKLKSLGSASAGDEPATDKIPAESDAEADQSNARLLQHDVDDAKAVLEAAEKAYNRAVAQHAAGAIEQAILDEQVGKYKRAVIQLERAKVKLESFLERHHSDFIVTDEPTADVKANRDQRLAALDVQEAEANLAAAKTKYERFKRHYEDKAIEQSLLDEQAEKYKRAQIQLERAKTKLGAFDRIPAGDDAANEPTKSSSDQRPIDESQIVWRAHGSGKLGLFVEPRKPAYLPHDVLTATLFVKNTGEQAMPFTVERGEILESLGIDLEIRDLKDNKLPWEWGPAHEDPGHNTQRALIPMVLGPGGIYQLPAITLLVGRREAASTLADEKTVFAFLDVKQGQAARLVFKLTQDRAGAGMLKFESAPFEFRVDEPVAEK